MVSAHADVACVGSGGGGGLRVGIIAPPWLAVPPIGYGGTEQVVDVLARGLAGDGHDVVLYTTGDATCPVRRRWTYPRSLGVAPGDRSPEQRHVMDAYDALRDVDIVHDHTQVGPAYGAALGGRHIVATNHGTFAPGSCDMSPEVADRIAVVAISHHHASTAKAIRIARVIHHGLDLASVPVGEGAGGYALFLGRMNPDKGVVTAIGVARQAGVPLVLAAKMSEPTERSYFQEVVRPLLGREAVYVGEVGPAEKYELLGGASCLLNPLQWPEPFGLVMVEALATGTPVVTTRRGSAPEIVHHGVTGFVGDDEEALVAGVVGAPELSRALCRAEADRRFSMGRMVDDHVALYRDVLADGCMAYLSSHT